MKTKAERNELRELEKMATPGDWTVNSRQWADGGISLCERSFGKPGMHCVGLIADNAGVSERAVRADDNAEFIVNARNALIPLIDQIDELERRLEVARIRLQEIGKNIMNLPKETLETKALKALVEMGSGAFSSGQACSDTSEGSSSPAESPASDPTAPSESVDRKSAADWKHRQNSGGADFDLHGEFNMHHCLTCNCGHPVNQPCKPLAESVRETVAAMSSAVAELPVASGADFGIERALAEVQDALLSHAPGHEKCLGRLRISIDSARAENERLKAACITFEENSAACVEEFEGRLKAENRAERAEKELSEKRIELKVHKQFAEQLVTALEAERDALKKKLEGVEHANEETCTGGCGGTVGHGHIFCVGCQEGANVLHAVHRKQRDEAQEDAQAAKEGWAQAEDDIETERNESRALKNEIEKLKEAQVEFLNHNAYEREIGALKAEVERLKVKLDEERAGWDFNEDGPTPERNWEEIIAERDGLKAKVERLRDYEELRPELRDFAQMMERTLREHDGTRGDSWESFSFDRLFAYLQTEVEELRYTGTHNGRCREAVDVANFAMFIFHVAARAALNPEKPEDKI